jgi:hypothetical protein
MLSLFETLDNNPTLRIQMIELGVNELENNSEWLSSIETLVGIAVEEGTITPTYIEEEVVEFEY